MTVIDRLKETLQELGLSRDRVVLVGGLAIDIYTDTEATKDVDFAVMTEDFDKIQGIDIFASVKRVEYGWGFVDFLDPESYVADPRRADELIEYIKRHRSFKVDGLYVANPEVVFYTRLVIGNWGVYLEKDIRDFRRGLLIEKDRIYAGIKAIADIFDTRHLVNGRLEVLEEYVQSNFPKGL